MTPLASVLVIATLGATPAEPPAALAPPSDTCWVAPLQVSLQEMAMMGHIAEQVARSHCSRKVSAEFYDRFPGRTFVVARNRFLKFHLFGQPLSAGLDVVVQPGFNLDTSYVKPTIDLPESWTRAIDLATYPVLAVGSATIITVVLVRLLR